MYTASKRTNSNCLTHHLSAGHMKYDLEQVNVLFHNRAKEIMLSLYQEFKYATMSIDRQWEENLFQQQRGKYVSQLKHRLNDIVLELMDKLDGDGNRGECGYLLNRFSQEYVQEFSQKIRSL